jgi:cbb3-type cytochrome oxidase subunit 3
MFDHITLDQFLLMCIIFSLAVVIYALEQIKKEIHALRLDRLP